MKAGCLTKLQRRALNASFFQQSLNFLSLFLNFKFQNYHQSWPNSVYIPAVYRVPSIVWSNVHSKVGWQYLGGQL